MKPLEVFDVRLYDRHSGNIASLCEIEESEVMPDDRQDRAELSGTSINEFSTVSTYNRLKHYKHKWKEAGADCYIMNVIEEGYKIPFKEIPDIQMSKNNKSARDNPKFVEEEIDKLLAKKCISDVQDEPHVTNPLTVAYNKKGKPRLVLDCRNINDKLHKFKFKYEDL